MDGRERFLVYYWSIWMAVYSFYHAIGAVSGLALGSGTAELGYAKAGSK
jgi:hypothetical protein